MNTYQKIMTPLSTFVVSAMLIWLVTELTHTNIYTNLVTVFATAFLFTVIKIAFIIENKLDK